MCAKQTKKKHIITLIYFVFLFWVVVQTSQTYNPLQRLFEDAVNESTVQTQPLITVLAGFVSTDFLHTMAYV